MKAMHELTIIVEKKILEVLPNKFVLVFDGWTLDGTSSHFIGIFAVFCNEGSLVITLLLLLLLLLLLIFSW